MEGLQDEPKPGIPRPITDEAAAAVIVRTLESMPRNATHWSSQAMAKESVISASSVERSKASKLPTDKLFIDKVRDIVIV